LTNIFDVYRDPAKHDDLKAILDLGAQKHPAGEPDVGRQRVCALLQIVGGGEIQVAYGLG
jgi:hypothetical protein